MTHEEIAPQLPIPVATELDYVSGEFDAPSSVRTFVIADVRGFTRFTHEHGDEAAAELVQRFAQLSRESAEEYGGQLTELRGDEALLVFHSTRSALRSAVDLQKRFDDESTASPDRPLPVGIGIDAGEPTPVEGGYRSGALNLAARLCALAEPGEILASEGVAHLARRTSGIEMANRGKTTLKGIPDPITIFQVGAEGELPTKFRPLSTESSSENIEAASIVGVVGACLGLGDVLFAVLRGQLQASLFGLVVSLVACFASLAAAGRIHHSGRGAAAIFFATTLVLVLAIGWWSLLAAPVLLVAAGLAFFSGPQGSTS